MDCRAQQLASVAQASLVVEDLPGSLLVSLLLGLLPRASVALLVALLVSPLPLEVAASLQGDDEIITLLVANTSRSGGTKFA